MVLNCRWNILTQSTHKKDWDYLSLIIVKFEFNDQMDVIKIRLALKSQWSNLFLLSIEVSWHEGTQKRTWTCNNKFLHLNIKRGKKWSLDSNNWQTDRPAALARLNPRLHSLLGQHISNCIHLATDWFCLLMFPQPSMKHRAQCCLSWKRRFLNNKLHEIWRLERVSILWMMETSNNMKTPRTFITAAMEREEAHKSLLWAMFYDRSGHQVIDSSTVGGCECASPLRKKNY